MIGTVPKYYPPQPEPVTPDEMFVVGILLGIGIGIYLLKYTTYSTCTECEGHGYAEIDNCPECGADTETHTLRRWDVWKRKIEQEPALDDIITVDKDADDAGDDR